MATGQRRAYFVHFWSFVKPYRRPLRTVYLLYFLNSLLNLIPAFSIRFFIDAVIAGTNVTFLGFTIPAVGEHLPTQHKITVSLLFLAAMIALIITANTIGVLMWRLGTRSVEKVLFDIKITIHNHINKLSLGYFSNERVGDIMTKAVGDVDNLNQLLKNSFVLVYQLIQIVLAPIMMAALSPLLFAVVLIPVPLIYLAFRNIKIKLKPMYREARETASTINSQIQEAITGIREVKAFNMEDSAREAYSSTNWHNYDIQNRIMRIFSFNHQLQYGSKDLGMVLIAVGGGVFFFLGVGNITVGVIASFLALSGFLFNPISSFLGFYDTIQRGLVSLERIIDFLNLEPDVKDAPQAVTLAHNQARGGVAYSQVCFSYQEGHPVLSNISFSVEPGTRVAIVGPSGSGKSTLLSLLLRFYDVDQGTITLDGTDVRALTQRSLRANMGIVFQETFLFFGTLRDNFRYVNPERSEEEIVAACRAANIWQTITELPDGLDTMVGERGVKLSGGQKQRIAIARVFLKDPAVVILDEATSAVDTVTEQLIQESIEAMLKGRTAFIIAHRLSTIRNCDRILVLDNATIAEQGTHQELLALNGVYARLNRMNERQTQ